MNNNSFSYPTLTVVIPVRDEQDNILPLSDEIDEKLRYHFDYEIIFVNDGSVDATQERILEAQAKNWRIRYLTFKSGRGQTEALDAGFKNSKGEFISMMDGDGQNDPADLPRLFKALDDSDMACGYRRIRYDSVKRRFVSMIANTVRNKVTRENIRDVGCSIRIFRRNILNNIQLYHGMHRFLPTLFRLAGYKFVEIPVNHRPRKKGKTKYGTWDRFKEGIADLFAVRWMQSRRIEYKIIKRSDEYGLGKDMAGDRLPRSSSI